MKQARVCLSVLCSAVLLFLSSGLEAARFCVTTTADGGRGSLRRAIECANEFPGPHDIEFNIQEDKEPLVIHLITPLEPITQQVFINGFSQPGSHPAFDSEAATIRIVLDGAGIDRQQFPAINGFIFDEGSSGSVVAGLSVVGFVPALPAKSDNEALETGNGIVLNSDCNKVCGVYVGVAPKNFVGATANGFGLLITGNHNTIGGVTPECRVVVSGNTFEGIVIRSKGLAQSDDDVKPSGEHNKVLGSYVGTDPSGTEARPNLNGIRILSERNIVGSNSLVSGNRNIGILLEGSHNTIAETWIGPDVSGFNCITLPQGTRMGTRSIPVPGGRPTVKKRDGAEGDGSQLMGVFVGSPVGGRRDHSALGSENILSCNLISCNQNAGVVVQGDGNILRGNFIGTGARGKTALANGVGLRVDSGKNTSIGGTVKGSGNLVSGNQREGILIRGGNKTSIEGNFIGTNASGCEAVPNNKTGIAIGSTGDGEDQELISDDDSGNVRAVICKNLISGNCENGIAVEGQNTVLVSDNVIGLDSAAKAGIPNQLNGIDVRNRAEVVVFSNLIACNGIENELCSLGAKRQPLLQDRCGVRVLFPACVAVLCTSSFNNENKGICTIPAPADSETDAAVLCVAPPPPALKEAKPFGCMIDVKGELQAKPESTYRLEFFANNTDRGEITEGMRPIGILSTLKTNEEGFAAFSLLLQEKPEAVKFVSATATLLDGKDSLTPLSTSEFSLNVRVA